MTAPIKAGRYELLDEVGRGAMGVVYRAKDPVIGRTVAVKTLRVSEHASGLAPDELLRRFHTEARAAGLLSHPNIVSVYDAGKEEDFFYITMELVEGKSLQSLLRERHAFPLARVLRVMQQACSALEFAHQHNVIHRDIKPANLILTPDDTLKISDFGTAKIVQFQTAQTGQIVGTPSYMSPEQIKGRPVDGRTDIFSLGGVLYELLTGSKPFPGDSITSVIYKIVSEEPAAPRDLDGSIHPGLSAIVLRALAKVPEGRFQSCVQFFDALQNYRDYKPDNYPQSAPESARRFVAEPQASAEELPEPALLASQEPARKSGSVWLALFLLCVIGVSGYKVWPPLKDLWLRSQPPPDLVLLRDQTPAADAVAGMATPAASKAAAAPAPATPPATPAPAATATAAAANVSMPAAAPLATAPAASVATVSQSQSNARATAVPVPSPAVATTAARPQAPAAERPAISRAAADWRQHIVILLAEAGLTDRVQLVASGSTVTLAGKLDTSAHRKLLGLLHDSPSDVQIVDHIEETSPLPSPSGQPGPQN